MSFATAFPFLNLPEDLKWAIICKVPFHKVAQFRVVNKEFGGLCDHRALMLAPKCSYSYRYWEKRPRACELLAEAMEEGKICLKSAIKLFFASDGPEKKTSPPWNHRWVENGRMLALNLMQRLAENGDLRAELASGWCQIIFGKWHDNGIVTRGVLILRRFAKRLLPVSLIQKYRVEIEKMASEVWRAPQMGLVYARYHICEKHGCGSVADCPYCLLFRLLYCSEEASKLHPNPPLPFFW